MCASAGLWDEIMFAMVNKVLSTQIAEMSILMLPCRSFQSQQIVASAAPRDESDEGMPCNSFPDRFEIPHGVTKKGTPPGVPQKGTPMSPPCIAIR